ncbi:uncharacterized protein LOC125660995 isoform X2 [Ostrea edulis]|uniref:uncharacterized protein LOC125660995 isoform X2 n=2 Tax=Ostrea edulis TaxID=37623 RepID=UPI0024AFDDDE|nr:uncharacterized protein LOC125660995 isoform X2 [Ostrea edulis]
MAIFIVTFCRFRNRGEDFLFTLTCVIENMEEDKDIPESQYQILFDKFLQMFGIKTMHKPFMKTKKSLLMGKTVHSQPDLLCFTPDPSRNRPVQTVCQVKKTEPAAVPPALDESPPKKKLRPLNTVSSSMPAIPDSLLAQHVGELFAYMDKSVSSRAILGMTVEQTHVRLTLLLVNEIT